MNNLPEIQDEVLDNFRKLFPMPCPKVLVSPNGMVMKFRVGSDRMTAEWLLMASRIIRENQLPLQADTEEWSAGGIVFDRWLVIEFVGTKTPLPCY